MRPRLRRRIGRRPGRDDHLHDRPQGLRNGRINDHCCRDRHQPRPPLELRITRKPRPQNYMLVGKREPGRLIPLRRDRNRCLPLKGLPLESRRPGRPDGEELRVGPSRRVVAVGQGEWRDGERLLPRLRRWWPPCFDELVILCRRISRRLVALNGDWCERPPLNRGWVDPVNAASLWHGSLQ